MRCSARETTDNRGNFSFMLIVLSKYSLVEDYRLKRELVAGLYHIF